jgi:putative flavoprotein involved in K+ transport
LPVFDAENEPVHKRGVVEREPGLYFVGLDFLHAATSETITGVGRDAAFVVRALASRIARHPAKRQQSVNQRAASQRV